MVVGASVVVGAAWLVVVVVVVVVAPLTVVSVSEGFCWQAVTLSKHIPAIAAAIMCFCMMFFPFHLVNCK